MRFALIAVASSLLFFASPLAARDQAILFVHLGSAAPDYLETAIEQAYLFNPKHSIYLVSDEVPGFAHRLPFLQCLQTSQLKKSRHHQNFNQMWMWSGFLKFTLERFFVIEEAMKYLNLDEVLHLESDVMLYTSIDEFRGDYIQLPFDSEVEGIASSIYFPTIDSICHFNRFLVWGIREYKNDMQALSQYQKRYPHLMKQLPVLPIDYCIERGIAQEYGTGKSSLFDARAIGQFLGGTDSKIPSAIGSYVNPCACFNPQDFSYHWELDEAFRSIPCMTWKGKSMRINCLHIHSKELQKFQSVDRTLSISSSQ